MSHDIPAALRGRELVVVDIEGNGAQPPEIVEIAILPLGRVVHPGNVITWLIRPRTPISTVLTRTVHGIGNSDVADCPTWPEVADQVSDALGSRILIAHHAAVEHRVLSAHLPEWRPLLVLDTMRLAKHVWPGLRGGYGLDRLVEHAHLDLDEYPGRRHRAGYDAWMTARLFLVLVEESGLDGAGLMRVAPLRGTTQPGDGLW
ncbi:3'-5' exonuclease [Actinokineospora inagensis]|uniref:3'-5' exonuclease n=1 Tax=Actinokineospora inagensis TaxID=103730 RepID=UPI0003F57515|nr:3'-5' exonuclease [Actinokineospora inagensis]